jgi:hypothetical protein
MPKKPTFFDFLNSIFYKRNLEYDKKICSAYLLSLWLAHDPRLIGLVNKINTLQFLLKDDIIYKYYYSSVPKGKRFIRWTKKDKADKKRTEKIKEISKEYNVSKIEATQIDGNSSQ